MSTAESLAGQGFRTDPESADSLATTAVRVDGLTRSHGERTVLSIDRLVIEAGEFVCLIGRSGSGKSTLLKALAGLDNEVAGAGTLEVPRARCVLFQDSRLLPWTTIEQNVTLALSGPDTRPRAQRALADVGLEGRGEDFPGTLSGGEQQRVALARGLVRDPELLLADEPFGALDALTRLRMHALLREVVLRHRPTVLLVTHDVDECLALAQRVVVLEAGRVVLDHRVRVDPSPEQLTVERRLLLEALGVDESAPTNPTHHGGDR